jgi:hypothetical protein
VLEVVSVSLTILLGSLHHICIETLYVAFFLVKLGAGFVQYSEKGEQEALSGVKLIGIALQSFKRQCIGAGMGLLALRAQLPE